MHVHIALGERNLAAGGSECMVNLVMPGMNSPLVVLWPLGPAPKLEFT